MAMIFIYRLLLFLFASSSLLLARTFTDTKGRSIEASITQVKGDKVTLVLDKNGKSHDVAISTLSSEDQKYVREWAKKSEDSEPNSVADEKPSDSTEAKNNFDEEWPTLITIDKDIEIKIVEEDKENKRFVYHSPNYEFICDARLSKNVVKKFAILFETTREYCRLLPVSMMKEHVSDPEFRNKVLLFGKKEDYVKNGGPPKSGGVYLLGSRDEAVMAPLESLGVKKVGSSYMHDNKKANDVICHELVHQLTTEDYYAEAAIGWFTEGLAEYIAATPYRSGRYTVRSNLSAIQVQATEAGEKGKSGWALGDDITAPNLKDYMIQPYSEFTKDVEKAKLNYGLGILITYYYLHMEEDRSSITAFLKALKDGKEGEEALNALLNGRSWDEMEKQISKAWRSRRVKITFE